MYINVCKFDHEAACIGGPATNHAFPQKDQVTLVSAGIQTVTLWVSHYQSGNCFNGLVVLSVDDVYFVSFDRELRTFSSNLYLRQVFPASP
jgi:hypothetical protein